MIFWFIVGTLIVYRLAAILTREDGPFDAFHNLRIGIWRRFGEDHWITEGVHCSLCTSLWISFVVGGSLTQLTPLGPVSYLLVCLGMAGGAAVLFGLERE